MGKDLKHKRREVLSVGTSEASGPLALEEQIALQSNKGVSALLCTSKAKCLIWLGAKRMPWICITFIKNWHTRLVNWILFSLCCPKQCSGTLVVNNTTVKFSKVK